MQKQTMYHNYTHNLYIPPNGKVKWYTLNVGKHLAAFWYVYRQRIENRIGNAGVVIKQACVLYGDCKLLIIIVNYKLI